MDLICPHRYTRSLNKIPAEKNLKLEYLRLHPADFFKPPGTKSAAQFAPE